MDRQAVMCYIVQYRTIVQVEEKGTNMSEREPTIQTLAASQVRQQWSELINQVFRGESRILVEKSGLPVAAIISADDLERFLRLEEARRREFQPLEETWAAFADVPDDELEKEIDRAVSEIRRARRNQKRPARSA